MTTVNAGSLRHALVLLATAALLLTASPAVAQTVSEPQQPTMPVITPADEHEDDAPEPVLLVERNLIDYGQTHELAVLGALGEAAEVFVTTASNPTPRLVERRVLQPHEELKDEGVGVALFQLRPEATTHYIADVDGVQSNAETVEVRRTVTIGVRQASGVYTFSGQIARAEAGLQVTIARLDAATKRVTGVASARTDAAGRYTIRTGLPEQ